MKYYKLVIYELEKALKEKELERMLIFAKPS